MMHRSMKSTTLSIRCVFLPSLEGFATVKDEEMREEYKRSVFFFTSHTYLFAAHQCIAIVLYGNLF